MSKGGCVKINPSVTSCHLPLKNQIFREGATNIIDISILALPLIAKQLGGVRHSREGVETQTHFKNDFLTKEEGVSIF